MIKQITIGIIGGGQLGDMLSAAAHQLGLNIKIYSDAVNSPAAQTCNHVTIGVYDDEEKLIKFAEECDIVTYEFENIKFLDKIKNLYPNAQALYISQNRLREKNFLKDLGISVAKFKAINSINDLENFEFPAILKTTEFGYDGKGQYKINSTDDIKTLELKGEYVLEKSINFEKEVSLILVRNQRGEIKFFPIPINIHKNGILDQSIVPSNLDDNLMQKIKEIGKQIADKLNYIGVLTIEFFIHNGEAIVNEIAPRVHNSGHYSMDACNISQFEAHIRAIVNLPLVDIKLQHKCKMINLIGDDINHIEQYLQNSDAKLHLYGKEEVKEGRKMGHVNLLNM